ncbi:hypothetical protein CIT292_09483 [Citrobacter youngae ATCC 29220]|uniref:Uncharacterized protein n=1 Tax=Citrobacter youngae ATCC 29220 TaxID=500640 RepID=D4BFB7_9ENTR|nr:hypothetical protein CIT292_09483 [Citrobacter youngae ATCC 29220]
MIWGLKGNVILSLPVQEEPSWSSCLPPTGAVSSEYKETIV